MRYLYPITSQLGFYNVGTYLNILFNLETFTFTLLCLGLNFDILLLIFIVVSCLLIYSLLLIQIETKTFETGVMRLVGLTKQGFIAMIIMQSAMFVLPSVLLGFALSMPVLWMLYSLLFTEDLGFKPSVFPSTPAVVQALAIGTLIPLLSSIVPIQRALSSSLASSLNTQRSKTSGILISLVDNTKTNLVPYLVFGSVAVIFGMTIYYFLPLGLL